MLRIIRWVTLGSLFLIPFLPLYVSNGLFFPFITGKHFAFRILVEVALVGWGLLMLLEPRYRPRFSWTLVLYGLLVVWMFIADLFAVNPHKALWSNYERMDGWVTLVHVFGFFLVSGSILAADKLWRRWWLTFLGASAFICLYGFLQVAGVFQINQGGVRLDATIGNAAYLAAYLLFVIAAAVWHAVESRGWLRYALLALAVLQTVLLFLTATRGAILGFVGAAAISAVLFILGAKGKVRSYGIGFLIGILVLVGGFFLIKDSPWIQSEPTLGRLASISLADGETRFTLWGMAMKGFAERPLTGWGHEGFNYVFNAHYVPSLYAQEPWFDRAHNVFIDWLMAGGAPAFVLFLLLLGSSVYFLYRRGTKSERILLTAALAAYAFQGFFVFDNLFTYVPLAAVFAMAHSVSSRPIKKLDDGPRMDESLFQTVAAPIGAVVLILLVWMVNVPSIMAGNDLIRGLSPQADPRTNLAAFMTATARGGFANQEVREQLVNFAGSAVAQPTIPADLKLAIAQTAATELAKEIERAPLDARLRLEYSYALRTLGDYEGALRELQVAQERSPLKQNLILEEGVLRLQAKDYIGARAAFARAYDLDPDFDDIAAYRAAGDILVGDTAAAKAFLVERFGTSTVTNNTVVLAYYEKKDFAELIPLLELRAREQAGDPTARFQLASIYAEAGQRENALRVLRELMKERPDLAAQIVPYITELSSTK